MFRKYEKTYRVPIPEFSVPTKGGAKRFLSDKEVQALFTGTIRVTEKLDGANVGIIRAKRDLRLQNRSSLMDTYTHAQWSFCYNWLQEREDVIMPVLKIGWVIHGELLYAKHHIYYDQLPDWFCAFAIWDGGKYVRGNKLYDLLGKMNLQSVPLIAEGYFDKADMVDLMPECSAFRDGPPEGMVVWNDRKQMRGKIVRPEFITKLNEDDEHWLSRPIVENKLKEK